MPQSNFAQDIFKAVTSHLTEEAPEHYDYERFMGGSLFMHRFAGVAAKQSFLKALDDKKKVG